MDEISRLKEFLVDNQIPHILNASLKKYTSFQVGGTTEILTTPVNHEQCALLQKFILAQKIPWFILAGGSNVLVSDRHFFGVTIKLNLPTEPVYLQEKNNAISVSISANARAPSFARKMSLTGYTGLEFLTTIPGEMGGSIIQNAGCYGYEIKNTLDKVTVCEKGAIREISNKDCEFSYRNSLFKGNTQIWVLGADFHLNRGNPEEIQSRIDTYRNHRIASQPKNRKSAGSVFKNPDGKKAWELLDQAGLRGYTKGDAEISQEHCNFIVNKGNASAEDILYLIGLAEQKVAALTGVRLEREIVLLGNFSGNGSG